MLSITHEYYSLRPNTAIKLFESKGIIGIVVLEWQAKRNGCNSRWYAGDDALK